MEGQGIHKVTTFGISSSLEYDLTCSLCYRRFELFYLFDPPFWSVPAKESSGLLIKDSFWITQKYTNVMGKQE